MIIIRILILFNQKLSLSHLIFSLYVRCEFRATLNFAVKKDDSHRSIDPSTAIYRLRPPAAFPSIDLTFRIDPRRNETSSRSPTDRSLPRDREKLRSARF